MRLFSLSLIGRLEAERAAQKRLEYLLRMERYTAGQFVFVDESSHERWTTFRGKAHALCGRKATRMAFNASGQRYALKYSFSVAMIIINHQKAFLSFFSTSFSEVILYCELVNWGSFGTETFAKFIEYNYSRICCHIRRKTL